MIAAFLSYFALKPRRLTDLSPSLSPAFSLSAVRAPGARSVRRRHLTMTTSQEMPTSIVGPKPVYAQCMLRVNWPEKCRRFYGDLLGMTEMTRFDFPDFKFSLIFFAYTRATPPAQSTSQPERAAWLWSRPEPTIELTWNWPADTYEDSVRAVQEEGYEPEEIYATGNEEPRGFGYVQISVSDVDAAVSALRKNGVTIIQDVEVDPDAKPLACAMVADPDGYHVRLVGPRGGGAGRSVPQLDPVFSSVMIRVKDPLEALPFFSRLGFSLVAKQDRPGDKITDYFLAVSDREGDGATWACTQRACTITARHEWGSESKDGDVFVNGNKRPNRGFGHVGITVKDVYDAINSLEGNSYKVVRKPSPFADVGTIAFIAEPSTEYWVELINREGEGPETPYEQPVA